MKDNALLKKKIRKYFEYLYTKTKVLFEQRIFSCGDVNLKYIYKECKSSDVLVVVFSACVRNGLKSRYNYVKTLEGFKVKKLFILDDFAKDKRGAFYLGKHFTFDEEKATKALIEHIYSKTKCKKVVMCGSSKGGYAALNFGLQIPNSTIITGSPQYILADYLMVDNHNALEHIIDDIDNEERKDYLNKYLKNRIYNCEHINTHEIYIHYSNREHTYSEHVIHLLEDLKKCSYTIYEDIADYTNHSDISYYYPDYLKKCLVSVVENDRKID